MKTSDLTGAALDLAVATALERKMQRNPMGPQSGHGWWIWEETPSGLGGILLDKSIYMEIGPHIHPKTRQSTEKFSPSTIWEQGGPIIERESIYLWKPHGVNGAWSAMLEGWPAERVIHDDKPLTAAMRCYVTSKLGAEVEIPEELT